ncbi:MAG: hypothetical protein RL641_134 [Candidatus Parcubacteria bacterium]|jgi:hypothetical protein
MENLPKNTFFDINKLPKEFGILVFPISLARVDHATGQSPAECLEYIKHFSPSKVSEPKIGLNMIYGDYLYLHSRETASDLKGKFMNLVMRHNNGFRNLLLKEKDRFQIQHGFFYEVWNQLYLNYKGGDFDADFKRFKKMYENDTLFKAYVKEDATFCGRELTEEQENFFLEEHFILYLISKKRFTLPNEYIQGREEWVLWCYPGVPIKGQVYVYQQNLFKLDAPENPYQTHSYDLQAKKLIDYSRIELETYDYKY